MEGIVVSKIKYNDYTLIVNLVSKESGKKAYLKSISKKSKEHLYFEPLNLIDFKADKKGKNKWEKIKEVSLLFHYPKKNQFVENSIRYFISEFLFLTMHEEENPSLFNFLKDTILAFENKDKSTIVLDFLVEIAPYKGLYMPIDNKPYFDLLESEYCSNLPSHSAYLNTEELKSIHNYSLQNKLNREERRNAFQAMFKFYRYHFDALDKMKSIEVLREVID